MDNLTKKQLLKTLQKEFVRRNLIQYFESKGYDNFLIKPYPPSLMDITERINVLDGVIEVEHYLEDINVKNNMIKVGWNLFVLGNQRAFLGHTTHQNLTEIENGISECKMHADGPISIKELVEWVVHALGESSKLQDIYQYHNNQKDSIINTGYIKPYKRIPDMRRRV